jgi:protein disulfide-isomerase A1
VWVTADPIAYAERASRIALRPGQWPAFGIEDRVKGTKFAFSEQGQSERLDRETIQLVVNQFLAGELKSSVKSEPIPSAQPDAVVKVVADTYEQLVTHNGNDVLMLFYSPSCGHCKAMAPSYDRLAQLLQPFTDRLTVAKIDATANDVWPNVDSYPTIKFIASESKDDPIVYSGDRTVHDLIEFVKDKGGKELAKLLPNITEGEDTMALHDEL